jgi:hypothetical protein
VASQVHTGGIERQRHVETIVNQQGHAVRGESGLETCPQGIQVTGAKVFLAQLDSSRTSTRGGSNDFLEGTPSRLLAVCDNIETKIDPGWLRGHV